MSHRLIDSSLAELRARKNLRNAESSAAEELQNEENIELISTTDEEQLNVFGRRPYLNYEERKFSSKLPESALMKYFKPGEFIHVPMTREEQIIIYHFTKFTQKSGDEFNAEDLKELVE